MKSTSYLAAATLLLTTVLSATGLTVKYPEADPAFTVTLPEGWTATPDKDGNIDCESGDGTKYGFSIVTVKGITEAAKMKAFLPKWTQTVITNAKLSDGKLGKPQNATNAQGIELLFMESTAKTSGTPLVLSFAGFAPAKSQYYGIFAIQPAAQDKAHTKEMGEVFESITPIGAKSTSGSTSRPNSTGLTPPTSAGSRTAEKETTTPDAAAGVEDGDSASYPKENPSFTFTLPSGWTSKLDKDKNLDLFAGDGSGFSLSFMPMEDVADMDGMKELIPAIIKASIDKAGLKNAKTSSPKDTTSHGIPFRTVELRGSQTGVQVTLAVTGFSIPKGKSFVLMAILGGDSVYKAHTKDMEAVIRSVTPVSK